MTYILILILNVFNLSSKDECFLAFEDAIFNETFKSEFKICDYASKEVNLFDLDNLIYDYPLKGRICNSEIKVFNTTCQDHPAYNSIVLYNLEQENHEIKLYFMRPYSGAAVVFTYEVKASTVILTETEIGSF